MRHISLLTLSYSAGRAFPDVSAQASRFVVFVDGRRASISGTSASSPAFAGVVGLLNDVRIAAGKPPLGFLNPFLYSTGLAGFNDITSGVCLFVLNMSETR